MAFLNKGLKITLEDKREGQKKKESFRYEGGIKEFIQYINKNNETITDDIFYTETKAEKYEAEVAIQYTTNYNEFILSYANNINTPEGGFHLSGLKSALTRAINDYARRNKFIKEKESFLGEDVREGITAVSYTHLTLPTTPYV